MMTNPDQRRLEDSDLFRQYMSSRLKGLGLPIAILKTRKYNSLFRDYLRNNIVHGEPDEIFYKTFFSIADACWNLREKDI